MTGEGWKEKTSRSQRERDYLQAGNLEFVSQNLIQEKNLMAVNLFFLKVSCEQKIIGLI